MDVPIAANVLGTLGAICWSIQLIPQIIINYNRHNTIGLQPSMMLLWACAGVPLGAYNISENFNIALRIQPQILTTLSLITWGQCQYYGSKWSLTKCLTILFSIAALFGGIEVALIFALKAGKNRNLSWPSILMGVASTVLLSAGVLRHYWDIYIHRTVRGISFIFVAIDAAGDVTSLISIFFQSKLDILGIVIYSTEFALWCGVFACGGYFNLLPYLKQKIRAKKERNANVITPEPIEAGGSDALEIGQRLGRIGSSTSVFRTSGSMFEDVNGVEGSRDVVGLRERSGVSGGGGEEVEK